jgi:hypothetical protein
MMHLTCDGCGQRIGEHDAGAARRVPIPAPTRDPQRAGEFSDWCGKCVQIIRSEVPRLAREAREARRTAAGLPAPLTVAQRARNIWPIGGYPQNRTPRPLDGAERITFDA